MEGTKKQEIASLLEAGELTAKEIAEKTGCYVSRVYLISEQTGKKPRKPDQKGKRKGKTGQSACAKYDEEIRRALERGEAKRALARQLGVSRGALQCYCRVRGYKSYATNASCQGKKEEEVTEAVASSSPWRYVGGYTGNNNHISVECPTCGGVFETSFKFIRKTCPYCEESAKSAAAKAKAKAKRERQAAAEERARINAEKEKARKERAAERNALKPCACCGAMTNRPKYCSNKCQKKALWKANETRRRLRAKAAGRLDNDITVEGLYRRDKGQCWICGLQCNQEDYTMRGDVFIAGDWYPSIDHVRPISKGGTHTWENVRLAHRMCNTYKRDLVW